MYSDVCFVDCLHVRLPSNKNGLIKAVIQNVYLPVGVEIYPTRFLKLILKVEYSFYFTLIICIFNKLESEISCPEIYSRCYVNIDNILEEES